MCAQSKYWLNCVFFVLFVVQLIKVKGREPTVAEVKTLLVDDLLNNGGFGASSSGNGRYISSFCKFEREHDRLKRFDITTGEGKDAIKYRFGVYCDNKRKMLSLNAETLSERYSGFGSGSQSRLKLTDGTVLREYYGETDLADVAEDEFRAMLIPLNIMEEDISTRRRLVTKGCVYTNGVSQSASGKTDNAGACQKIKSQGTSSACWAFASTAQSECNHGIQKSKKWFSEQYALDASPDSVGTKKSGGHMNKLTGWLNQNGGHCSNYKHKFSSWTSDRNWGRNAKCNVALTPSLQCYELRDRKSARAITQTARYYAMDFAIMIPTSFQFVFGNYISVSKCNAGMSGGHAMTIVGQDNGSKIKIKNSWGYTWGSHGYVWMDVSVITNSKCGIGYPLTMSSYVHGWDGTKRGSGGNQYEYLPNRWTKCVTHFQNCAKSSYNPQKSGETCSYVNWGYCWGVFGKKCEWTCKRRKSSAIVSIPSPLSDIHKLIGKDFNDWFFMTPKYMLIVMLSNICLVLLVAGYFVKICCTKICGKKANRFNGKAEFVDTEDMNTESHVDETLI